MQALHFHWLTPTTPGTPGRLFLWLETSVGPAPKRDRRRKSAQPHPFAADPEALERLLSELGLKTSSTPVALTLWLPTNNQGPLPSPALIHDWDVDVDDPILLPWIVKGVSFTAANALQLLAAWPRHDLPPRTHLGDTGRFWLTAFDFVLEILAQQLVRPTLVQLPGRSKDTFEARWQPVLDRDDIAPRAARLAAALPAVCRAEADDPNQTIPPRAILDSFLNHLTDAALRHWGSQQKVRPPTGKGPASAWLNALFSPNPVVKAAPAQLQHFAPSLRAWERALLVAGDAQYRIAFRLEAPGQQTNRRKNSAHPAWHLHYLLQARDDPSLLVPAGEVWQADRGVLQTLDRHFDRPQERLLTGLGYAARFCPPIQASLKKRQPDQVSLDSAEAYAFLRDCAPELQRAGFGLLVPPWWNKPGTRLGVRLQLQRASGPGGEKSSTGHMSLDNLVRYQWHLSLGETTLTQAEFKALVALKSPLVQIRGQWVQLDPEQIETAIGFWQNQDLTGTMSLQQALFLGAEGNAAHDGLPIDGVDLDDWLAHWRGRLQGEEKLEPLPEPGGLTATLRPYQKVGYAWLHFARRWGLGVILADDMGLGKTIQTLTLIQRLKGEQGGLPGPILLICPTSVVTNWDQERRKFTPDLRALLHQGADRIQDEAFINAAAAADIVLTSYALARRDGSFLQQVEWFGLVLDEAQNIKNAQTKQAQLIRRLPAGFRLALTGTPVENRLSELWSIMHFLNPGYLGSQKRFRRDFAIPIERHGDMAAAARLRRLTRPFILRRVKTDPSVIQDLPDKQEMKVYCHLSEEQATLYEAVVQEGLAAVAAQDEAGIERKGAVLSLLMQLKQICNHPAQYLHEIDSYDPLADRERSGKLARLGALLEEILAEGDRLLIFSQFTEMAALLKEWLQVHFGVPTLYLHGGVPAAKRADMVARFQSDGGPPIFLLSLKAGGTGLNLTRANHVFHFDRWWNPAVEDQATDRAFRIGQTKNVLVHKFVCLGTLEEQIDAMIETKKALAEQVVGSGESWLTELSTADLRQLVELRRS